MRQRAFPWIHGLTPPVDAPRQTVASCESYGVAARVSLRLKSGGPWSESWLASRLGISRGYLSRVLNGQQPMPEWMLRPIAYATGSRLILQYHSLQQWVEGEDSKQAVRRIADQALLLAGCDRRHEAREAA